jgi:metal-responsive CopG/Arc/MetJ family transcriptional regulator
MVDRVVKIDEDLLMRVEKLIENKFKKIKYGNRKQFINYAVIELLEKEEKDVKRE